MTGRLIVYTMPDPDLVSCTPPRKSTRHAQAAEEIARDYHVLCVRVCV